MSEKKRASTNTAMLAEAAETATLGGAAVSYDNHTTLPGDCQRIYKLLQRGEENALSARDISKMTGLDTRYVRGLISKVRRTDLCILSSPHGFYLPGTQEERARCVRSLRHRAGEIMKTARAVERGGAELDG
jgi:hypothetical protein